MSETSGSTLIPPLPVREGLFHIPISPEDQPHLLGGKCHACGEHSFPRRSICPSCRQEGRVEEVALCSRGALYTYCVVNLLPEGFQEPYALGYVDLPEGVRIFAPLSTKDFGTLKIGMEMELVIEELSRDAAGRPIVCYKFKAMA